MGNLFLFSPAGVLKEMFCLKFQALFLVKNKRILSTDVLIQQIKGTRDIFL